MNNRVLSPLFIIFLLISPVIYPAISEGVYMEKTVKENDAEETEKLVHHIIVFPYSQPIPLQIINLLYIHGVQFGTADFYDITDDEPITVHVNYSVIWQDNHAVLLSRSEKHRISTHYAFAIAPDAFVRDINKKIKTPVGFYTLRIELYVEEDNSSKVVEIPGVMFYYICMLSTGPSLLTYLKVVLSYIPWVKEYLHDFIYSNVWDP